MTDNFELNAVIRPDVGKGASRRLRRDDKVPAIVYGAHAAPQNISLEHNKINRALENEAFYTKILTLNVDGKPEKVVLKSLQRHPYKPRIAHVDFQRISATEKIIMRIPLHFMGADVAPGVKQAGGIVSHLMSQVEVRCLPADLPEFIEVDLSKLELNQTIHLSNLVLPKNVEIIALTHKEDKPVATVYIPVAIEEETAAPTAAPVESETGATAEGAAGTEGAAETDAKGKAAPAADAAKGKADASKGKATAKDDSKSKGK